MRNIIPPRDTRKYPMTNYTLVPPFGIELLFKDIKPTKK